MIARCTVCVPRAPAGVNPGLAVTTLAAQRSRVLLAATVVWGVEENRLQRLNCVLP